MIKESSSQLKSRARGTLLGRYGQPMGAFLLVDLVVLALESLISMVIPTNTGGIILSYIAMLIVAIFSTLLQSGYSYILLNMARGKQYQLRDLIFPFQTMPDHVIILSLRLFLLAIAAMLPFLAGVILLLVMPEVLALRIVCVLLLILSMFLALKLSLDYSQIYLLYLDNPYLPGREIMQRSKELMKGNRIRYFYLLVSFIGMLLLGLISFGVGLLWIIPYMSMTEIEFYRDLINEHVPAEANSFQYENSTQY